MKKMNLVAMTVAMALSCASAWADVSLTGSFKGKVDNKEDVDLLFRPVPGREGSYLALMIREQGASVLLADPLDATSFALVPIQVTSDGEVGENDDNPSLVLSVISAQAGKRPSFTLSAANASATNAFQGTMIFNGKKKSHYTWIEPKAGFYRKQGPGSSKVTGASMTPIDQDDFEGSVTFSMMEGLNGRYSIFEKQPGTYTLKRVNVTSTGARADDYPKKVAVFVHRDKFLSSGDFMLMVNPANDVDVQMLKLK